MKIIIVGCGKVGLSLTAQLTEEGHNVTVIDIDGDTVRRAATLYDVMGIEGNGTSYQTLLEADIEHADILMAVTMSDEVNLLCCVIARRSRCRTVARVRNPIYTNEYETFQQRLGVALIINPERSAAQDIKQLLQFPSALEADEFLDGNIELIRYRIPANSALCGVPLKDSGAQRGGVLVCIAERNDEVFVPGGDFIPQEGDILSVISVTGTSQSELHRIGVAPGKVRNVAIIGGGSMSVYLARLLKTAGIRVKLIELDKKRCEELCDLLPDAAVIYGDGFSKEMYGEEHLDQADAIIAATEIDEENIVFSLYARENSNARIITKISHSRYLGIIRSMNLDSLVNPLDVATDHILQFVRGLSGSVGSSVEALYRLSAGRVEALEFRLRDQSPAEGIPIRDLKLKDGTILAAIMRGSERIIPGGNDCLKEGDSVIVVTTQRGFKNIDDIIAG